MKTKTQPFLIEHIDPLGQGVDKSTDKIAFISKTLPGEKGNAQIFKENSKVSFGRLNSPEHLTQVSKERIKSSCEHFNECNGCHFLHCSYENEIKFKAESFSFLTRRLQLEHPPRIIQANNRLHYRNRIQFHYNKKSRKIGLHMAGSNQITPVPNCLIANEEISKKIIWLYKNNNWLDLVSKEKNIGHIECYQKSVNTEAVFNINKSYAAGGFTQVNEPMNKELIKLIEDNIQIDKSSLTIDLFGGSGNLSKGLKEHDVLVVDSFVNKKELLDFQNPLITNLHKTGHIQDIENHCRQKKVGTLLLDPPRGGYKDLFELTSNLFPEKIIYISCFLPTAVRDLGLLLSKYKITNSALVDLFPSTHHFESVFFLSKSENNG